MAGNKDNHKKVSRELRSLSEEQKLVAITRRIAPTLSNSEVGVEKKSLWASLRGYHNQQIFLGLGGSICFLQEYWEKYILVIFQIVIGQNCPNSLLYFF